MNNYSKFAIISAFVIVLFSSRVQSSEVEKNDKTWTFSTALVYSTESTYRGALTSTSSSTLPDILIIYKNFLRIDPTSIQVFKTHNAFEFGAGLDRFAADGSPFRVKPETNNFRGMRKFSSNLNAYINWEPIPSLVMSSLISKGLIQNLGYYSYSSILIPTVPLLSVGLGYGLGDKNNNQYVFGKGAVGGAGHYDFIGELDLPMQLIKEEWKQVQLVFTYQQVRTAQAENRQSFFVRPDDHPKVFSALLNCDF